MQSVKECYSGMKRHCIRNESLTYSSSKLLSVIKPGIIEEGKYNAKPKTPFHAIENNNIALLAAKSIGVNIVNVGWDDLQEKKVTL
jgi:hypothetical protein